MHTEFLWGNILKSSVVYKTKETREKTLRRVLKEEVVRMGGGYETGSGSYPVTNFSIIEPPVSESNHDAHCKEWGVIRVLLNRRCGNHVYYYVYFLFMYLQE
jgi:hypothetical protein